jgi:hypothetical protein
MKVRIHKWALWREYRVAIHKDGCEHTGRRVFKNAEVEILAELSSLQDLIEDDYCHQIEEGSMTWKSAIDEYKIAPCCRKSIAIERQEGQSEYRELEYKYRMM